MPRKGLARSARLTCATTGRAIVVKRVCPGPELITCVAMTRRRRQDTDQRPRPRRAATADSGGDFQRTSRMSKVWFITGAGSGIGANTARAPLKSGDRVVATGRNIDKVRNALRDVAAEHLEVLQLDVSDEAQAKTVVDQARDRFGR